MSTAGAPTKADNRHLKSEASEGDAARDREYKRGLADAKAGREPEPPFDDELAGIYQDGYDEGQSEKVTQLPGTKAKAKTAARAPRGARVRDVGRQAAGHVRTVGGSIYRARSQGQRALAGGGSVVGILVAVVGVILLYLLLTKAGLAASAISGVSSVLTWFVAPKTLPF